MIVYYSFIVEKILSKKYIHKKKEKMFVLGKENIEKR